MSPLFCPGNFTVLTIAFKSSIRFKLTFVGGVRLGLKLISPPWCHVGQGARGLLAPTSRCRTGVRATESGPGVRAGGPSTFHWPFSWGFTGTWGSTGSNARLLSTPRGTGWGSWGLGRAWFAQGSLCQDRSRRPGAWHLPCPAPQCLWLKAAGDVTESLICSLPFQHFKH